MKPQIVASRRTLPFRAAMVGLALVLGLSACAHPPRKAPPHGDNPLAGCCEGAERTPAWLVALAEPAAPVIGHVVGRVVWREGYLAGDTEAMRLITETLRPLDIVVVSSKGRLSGHTLPGLFPHAATYLGTETELRRLGIWEHGAFLPHQADIRAGKVFVEADYNGVHLSRPETVLNVDRVAILRRVDGSRRTRQRAAAELARHLGEPFDFHFDGDDNDRLFCTELVDHARPGLALASRQAYGRRIILGDEMVADALSRKNRLRVVLYLKGDGNGVAKPGNAALARDIGAAWQPTRGGCGLRRAGGQSNAR
ncbi:hypothetical protein FQ775_23300 [Nitratireductor mangrovi]|uniref:Permuted papain-like amidase YaeF/Yiix C92 family enzyme n=1 Tax=Nitratireductor mangrovi TaxID=2599600 RepID=A0A5B8L541_9HYPH|nr:YiiX/YebB-like N1pC/P60 family cysteine hydrolase [Nitratireductor mangrovi]QDZ03055.1 hypothetical protein FQ775_23300 [Nitratireductor mangrovi]